MSAPPIKEKRDIEIGTHEAVFKTMVLISTLPQATTVPLPFSTIFSYGLSRSESMSAVGHYSLKLVMDRTETLHP